MRTLDEDRDEMDTDAGRRWVQRLRSAYGIHRTEGACWFVDVEGGDLVRGTTDSDTKWLGPSPGDAIAFASSLACGAVRRDGIGRWTLEVFGDGVSAPTVLRVYPRLDEVQP